MKVVTGLILVVILLPSLFSSVAFGGEKIGYKTTKELREFSAPAEDKTVKIISITKSRWLPILYIVGVEVCAGKDKLYSPQLELKSDRDTIKVKVVGLIMPNTCKIAEFFIRANNPDSITVSFFTPVYVWIPIERNFQFWFQHSSLKY
jgi:hypothetical protein